MATITTFSYQPLLYGSHGFSSSAVPGLSFLWPCKTIYFLPCNHWNIFWVLFFLCSRSYMNMPFFLLQNDVFFAFVWFPKIFSLWLLTKSLLRTLFNCSLLYFHFASWHCLNLCTVCSSHLPDHPNYSTSQWGFHTSLPEEFCYCYAVFVEYLLRTPRKP